MRNPKMKKAKMPVKAKAGMDYGHRTASNTGNYVAYIPSRTSRTFRSDGARDRVPALSGQARYDLINRARALAQQNPYARQLLGIARNSIVGPKGFLLTVTSESNSDWAHTTQTAFRKWFETACLQGRNHVEFQRLVCLHLLTDGDVGVMLSTKGEGGCLQIIPGSSIVSPSEASDAWISDGVEHGDVLDATAYHMSVGTPGARQTKRVQAKYFAFAANRLEATDLRGISCFHGYYDLFSQLDSYTNSVIAQAKIQADQCMAITTEVGQRSPIASLNQDTDGARMVESEIASIMYLPVGSQVELLKPETVSLDHDKMIKSIMSVIAPSVGCLVDQLYPSMGNYSSSVHSVQSAFQAFQYWQSLLVALYSHVYRWWLKNAIDVGTIPPAPEDATFAWITNGHITTNRVESVQADQAEITCGFSSYTEVMARRGKDAYATLLEIAQDTKDRKDLGLPPAPISTFVQQQQSQTDIEALAEAVTAHQSNSARGLPASPPQKKAA